MIVFNFDPGEEIYVKTTGDGAEIRFDNNTLGFELLSEKRGYSITNDWNNRHFTIGFGEDSVLYHITREDLNNRNAGKGDMMHAEFIAEIYGYVRWLAPPVHEDKVDIELVGLLDFDALKEYMTKKRVTEYSDTGLSVDNNNMDQLVNDLCDHPKELGELFQLTLEPIPFDEVRESDEIVFVHPSYDRIDLVFLYPNNRVSVISATELYESIGDGGGSQIIDHLFRSISTE